MFNTDLTIIIMVNTVLLVSQLTTITCEDEDYQEQIQEVSRPPEIDFIWQKIHTEGHWASWGPWTCDAFCGQGAYFRKRHCIPSKEFGIPVCKGKTIERNAQECTVKCPGINEIRKKWIGPKLSDAETLAHSKLLKSSHGVFQRNVGGTIRLDCFNTLAAHFLSNYPKSSLYWEQNGHRIQFDFNRMRLSDYSILEIANLRTCDTGVYTCKMQITKRLHLTLLIFSVIVIGKPYDMHVKDNTGIKVRCNSNAIGILFPGLQAQWIVNDTQNILKDYGQTSPEKINEDILTDFSENDTGLWVCIIKDPLLNRTWRTNAFYVKVIPIEWLLLVIMVVIITGAVILGTIIRIKRKRKQKLLKRINDILKISADIEEKVKDDAKLETKEYQRIKNEDVIEKIPIKVTVQEKEKRRLKVKRTAISTLEEKIQVALQQIASGKQEIGTLKDAIYNHEMVNAKASRENKKIQSKIEPKSGEGLEIREFSENEEFISMRRLRLTARPLTLVRSESSGRET